MTFICVRVDRSPSASDGSDGAGAVDVALQTVGPASQRLTPVGCGEDFPVADNATESNRALNRWVEAHLAENDQPVRQRL